MRHGGLGPEMRTTRAALGSGVLRPALDDLRRLSPTLYCKSRNTVALCEWLWRRYVRRGPAGAEAYDDHFWSAQEVGDWPGFAELVVRLFAPHAVLDVGCGSGQALAALRAADPAMTLLGIDASAAGLRRARARGLPVERIDLAALSARAQPALTAAWRAFDLVLCLEVAEHLPPWQAPKLVGLLTTWHTVIFSAAHPNQGGVLHLNEQPPDYWIDRFASRGFRLDPRNDLFRRELAGVDLPPWYAANANVFSRSSL